MLDIRCKLIDRYYQIILHFYQPLFDLYSQSFDVSVLFSNAALILRRIMLKRPENRRQLLLIVVTVFALHAIFSGWIVDPNTIQDAELQQAYQEMLNEYQSLLATFRNGL